MSSAFSKRYERSLFVTVHGFYLQSIKLGNERDSHTIVDYE